LAGASGSAAAASRRRIRDFWVITTLPKWRGPSQPAPSEALLTIVVKCRLRLTAILRLHAATA
jgi:hypothetical protein